MTFAKFASIADLTYAPDSEDCIDLQVARGCHSCQGKECYDILVKVPTETQSRPSNKDGNDDDDEVCELCLSFTVRTKVNSALCRHFQ